MSWRGRRGGARRSLSPLLLSPPQGGEKEIWDGGRQWGNRQMNESDITNSHTLMRLIYCRHQQWWGGPKRRRGGGTDARTRASTRARTRAEWHTWPGGACVIAVCLTQPCVCCLDIYTSLSPWHADRHTDTHAAEPLFCFYRLLVTLHVLTS